MTYVSFALALSALTAFVVALGYVLDRSFRGLPVRLPSRGAVDAMRKVCPACRGRYWWRTPERRCPRCQSLLVRMHESFPTPNGDRLFLWVTEKMSENRLPKAQWVEVGFPQRVDDLRHRDWDLP